MGRALLQGKMTLQPPPSTKLRPCLLICLIEGNAKAGVIHADNYKISFLNKTQNNRDSENCKHSHS